MQGSIRTEGDRIRDNLIGEFRKIAEEDLRLLDQMLARHREMHEVLDRIDHTLDRMGAPRL